MDLLFFDCALYEQINDMKIDSYDKFINKMVNQANFKYATSGEGAVDGGLDFSVVGPLKMGLEAIAGKNFITSEEYSDGQRVFTLATLGGGSLLGKVISKIILLEELKLIEYVFEDMESFGEAIFKSFIEKVINEDSTYEEISGNICSLEIRKEFTIVSAEFLPSEMSSEYKIETDELFSLILVWSDINNSKLN